MLGLLPEALQTTSGSAFVKEAEACASAYTGWAAGLYCTSLGAFADTANAQSERDAFPCWSKCCINRNGDVSIVGQVGDCTHVLCSCCCSSILMLTLVTKTNMAASHKHDIDVVLYHNKVDLQHSTCTPDSSLDGTKQRFR